MYRAVYQPIHDYDLCFHLNMLLLVYVQYHVIVQMLLVLPSAEESGAFHSNRLIVGGLWAFSVCNYDGIGKISTRKAVTPNLCSLYFQLALSAPESIYMIIWQDHLARPFPEPRAQIIIVHTLIGDPRPAIGVYIKYILELWFINRRTRCGENC